MRVLILGGCGFIGGHLVDALIAKGHHVRVLDRVPQSEIQSVAGVDYVFGDFADKALVYEAASGVDVVYHLVSTTVPSTSNLDPEADVRGNLIPTLGLLSCMVQLNIRKIVYLSSGGTVYGESGTSPVPETHPLRPKCSYGVVKVAIENYLAMFQQLHSINYVVLRAANPYGENQGRLGVQGVVNTFLRKVEKGDALEIWGDGSVVRDFLYVGDLAELCVRAGESQAVGIFNAGSGDGVSILELVQAIEKVTGVSLDLSWLPARSYDVPRVVLDVSRARDVFGWTPTTSLESGLERMWQWISQ